MSDLYYITNEHEEFLIICDDQIYWSRHIIDASPFFNEEDAYETIKNLKLQQVVVDWRSGPPQEFLYKNPYLPPSEQRIRKDGELSWIEKRLKEIQELRMIGNETQTKLETDAKTFPF
jgi:hypothetical protein